jgi:hypothetical protein
MPRVLLVLLHAVEAILAKRYVKYLVRWRGYGPEHYTWEPKKAFDVCPELLLGFEAEHYSKGPAEFCVCYWLVLIVIPPDLGIDGPGRAILNGGSVVRR